MNENQIEQAISDFTTFMYHKGYRSKFPLDHVPTDKIFFSATLSECLGQHFKLYAGKAAHGSLKLTTSPPYESKLSCSLDIEFDNVKGFQIKTMRIDDQASGTSRQYRFQNNHQIPGAASLSGLFPKKNPWDGFLKGRKFRP